MEDSGKRQEFSTGAVRDSADNKSRPDLISPYAQMRKGEWLRLGAVKYAERNWEKGMNFSRCIASLERHLQQFKMGLINEDHLAAIAVNAEFLMHYEAMIERGLLPAELDDMPRYEQQVDVEQIVPDRLPAPVTTCDVLPVGQVRLHEPKPVPVPVFVPSWKVPVVGEPACVVPIRNSKVLTDGQKAQAINEIMENQEQVLNNNIDIRDAFMWSAMPSDMRFWSGVYKVLEGEGVYDD